MVIWTDHKNLAYLQEAKRLNARQARWALFFTRFNLTISYRPSSRNLKADALSHQFTLDLDPEEKEKPILPSSCFVGALTWEIERIIKEAQLSEPDPGTGPEGRMFVPTAVRSKVLHWAHTAEFACHPGKNRTTAFLQHLFWWPTSGKDTQEYVAACPVCARNKAPSSPPASFVHCLYPDARGLISQWTSSLVSHPLVTRSS